MRQFLVRQLSQHLIDTLLPSRCALCKNHLSGTIGLCALCTSQLGKAQITCFDSSKDLLFIGTYRHHLEQAVKALKFKAQRTIALPLAKCLAAGLKDDPPTCIIPVPLHPRRLRHRGFNQSLVLAQAIARELDTTCLSALRRNRNTAQQARLPLHRRASNVAGAFDLMHPERIANQDVLLVDDVFTTGATLRACADVLHGGGCKRLRFAVIARAE